MAQCARSLAAIALLALVWGADPASAPQPASPGRGAGQPPPAPVQLFALRLQNQARVPLTQEAIATPNVTLQHYGDGKNIVVATGAGPQLPRLFFGLCTGPCGFTLRDRERSFDLSGRASLQVTTIVSGFHRLRPIVKLPDGSLLIGDQAEGSTADYHRYDISFSDCRWLRLDPIRGVTLGGTWVQPDLHRVDEAGVFDVIPGSGVWSATDQPVEKQPAPPAGGWIAISSLELWGRPLSRDPQRAGQ